MTAIMTNSEQIVKLEPRLGPLTIEFVSYCRGLEANLSYNSHCRIDVVNKFRKELFNSDTLLRTNELELKLTCSIVLDLIAQGWELQVKNNSVLIIAPHQNGKMYAAKEMVRTGHLLGRDAQLREKSVVEFIRGMECRRLHKTQWHSIFSLMRDGQELSDLLRPALDLDDPIKRVKVLSQVIKPYIQFVEKNEICEHTGLRLADIWRYFRHTWVNEYKSVPGRSIMILIRDAAAPNHPVIGIAALGNSVVQHSIRDKWIGWHPQTFVKKFAEKPDTKTGRWLLESLETLVNVIYLKDLRRERICTAKLLRKPTKDFIQSLLTEADVAMKRHRQNPQKDRHKGQKGDVYSRGYWEEEARTFLYRNKRCRKLAQLMSIRMTLQDAGIRTGSKQELELTLKSAKVQSAISQLVRMIKAQRVGISMMDITVCGAIAPYNLLLGGKLVCMLLCSSEVTQYYAKRYGKQVSIIASSMKGEPVIRKPRLVLLCTTSLYGMGSSQYNRVRMPLDEIGGVDNDRVEYKNLGHSSGFGTYHFSRETIQLASTLISRRKNGRLVNSIFGEGVNPLLRKIREALELVGLRSDEILLHGNQRVTYGIRLAHNFREILLGLDERPSYLISQSSPKEKTGLIIDYWYRRWLAARIARQNILDEVANHTLTYPIIHGAAVLIPPPIDEEEMPLFTARRSI